MQKGTETVCEGERARVCVWLLRGRINLKLNGRMQCLQCDLAGDIRAECVLRAGRNRQLQTHKAEKGAERGYKTLISYFPVVTVKLTFSVPAIPVNGSLR